MSFDNLGAWQDALKKKAKSVSAMQNRIGKVLAESAVLEIRSRLPGGSNSRFEGYASTGELSRSLVITNQRNPGAYKVSLKGPPFVMMKGMVHENGAIITGRPGKPLRFQVKGKWVTTYRVVIRKKNWFRDGWLAAGQKPLQRNIRVEW